ncbi:MAG TPA: TorF family putative porin [Burkholderiales bacterium]|nr:TorF family putative porin [Burkholderiales bacterium]
MHKSVLALSAIAALAAPGLAAAAEPSPVAGNMSLVSEYRFRGIDQTFGKPALQGGFDYAHSSGAYLGNWNSNVNPGAGFNGANLEMDFYGGWKKSFGDFGADLGLIYYAYPGSTPKVDNTEIYLGGSWKSLSVKYYHAIDDYFSVPDSKNSYYLDFGFTHDFGGGFGLVAHYGIFEFKNVADGDYNDWKLGVTYDLRGWVLGAAYVDTDAKGDCGVPELYCFANGNGTKTRDAGKSTVVFSVMKTF